MYIIIKLTRLPSTAPTERMLLSLPPSRRPECTSAAAPNGTAARTLSELSKNCAYTCIYIYIYIYIYTYIHICVYIHI